MLLLNAAARNEVKTELKRVEDYLLKYYPDLFVPYMEFRVKEQHLVADIYNIAEDKVLNKLPTLFQLLAKVCVISKSKFNIIMTKEGLNIYRRKLIQKYYTNNLDKAYFEENPFVREVETCRSALLIDEWVALVDVVNCIYYNGESKLDIMPQCKLLIIKKELITKIELDYLQNEHPEYLELSEKESKIEFSQDVKRMTQFIERFKLGNV